MSRYKDYSREELEEIVDDRDSKNTKNVIAASVKIFDDYLSERGGDYAKVGDLDGVAATSTILNEILRKFYAEIRKQDGSFYAKKSFVTLRFGLQKHFLKTRQDDIINSDAFKSSNEMFRAVLVKMKKHGLADTVHKDPISPEDLEKLYTCEVFSKDSAETLQQRMFFEYMYYFCNRGRENLREIQKDDFEIKNDSTGLKYVMMTKRRQTKNHRGDETDIDEKEARMYEKRGDDRCPVSTFTKYRSKLHPENSNFWQRPRRSVSSDDMVWYDNAPVGRNTLNSLMKKISITANLSKKYTNHCVRATCITNLDQNGVDTRHIMSISGHKSESAIRSYSSRLCEERKRQIFEVLSNSVPSKRTCTTANHIQRAKSLPTERLVTCEKTFTAVSSETVSTNQQENPSDDSGIDFIEDIAFDDVMQKISVFENHIETAPSASTAQPKTSQNGRGPRFSISNSTLNFYFQS